MAGGNVITGDRKLIIFQDFVVERGDTKITELMPESADSFVRQTMLSEFGGVTLISEGGTVRLVQPEKKQSRFRKWFKGLFEEPKPPQKVLTVQEFFASVKNSVQELDVVAERADQYAAAIRQARETGQKALMEQLEAGLLTVRTEAQLVAAGQLKFVSEESIVQFYMESERGLRLDWLANFTRPLPLDVTTKKLAADAHGIFDNYIVLHFDPDEKSFSQTVAEKKAEEEARRKAWEEKKKDPILFGVVRGSRKLYFVADWVDEVCDLTLDAIAEKLGQRAVQELA